jgi:hypothetical protein
MSLPEATYEAGSEPGGGAKATACGAAAAASLFEARGNKTKCFTCAVVTTKENAVTLVLG